MTPRIGRWLTCATALGCLLAFAPAAAATPPNFTWSGGAASTSVSWSNAGNWTGASAPTPGESLGAIAFPQPTGCGSPCNALYSQDDVSGLTANALSVDDDGGYNISAAGAGIALSLGSGGITAAPGATVNTATPDVNWSIPLTLTADQSWSVIGAPGSTPYAGNLALDSPVTASASQALSVQFAHQGYLNETAGMQVGSFSATGANTADTGFKAAQNGVLLPTSLNSSPAAPVSVTDVLLEDEHAQTLQPVPDEIGPLTTAGAFIAIGDGNSPDAILAVQGAVSLDANTVTQFTIDQAGSTPSTDFSQLTATGNVALAGDLSIAGSCSMGTGSTATLITTSGSLSGTFANAPEGAIVAFADGCSSSLAARIHYTADSVTATVVSGSGTSTTLSASPTTATTNQPVTLTAVVMAGTPLYAGPAGTVEFLDGSTPITSCTAQPLTATNATSGTATCAMTAAAAASPTLSAVFTSGGSTLTGSTSAPLTLTVAKGATATTITAPNSTPTAGQGVTYTATIAPALAGALAPTGSVAFSDHGTTIPGCTAQSLSPATTATCTTTYTAAGTHAVTAAYQADGNFSGSSSSSLALTVKSPTSPAGSPGTAIVGHARTRGRVASVPISCTGAASCTVKLTLTIIETLNGRHVVAVTASKRKHRVIDLGAIKTTIAAGHHKTIKITLNRIGKQILASHRKLSVKLTLTQTTSGKIRTVARKLTFKAPNTRK